MRPTFIDSELEKSFQKNGYVSVPFLNHDKVEELKAYYFDSLNHRGGSIIPQDEAFNTETKITYDFTFIDKNVEYKKAVFNKITQVFESYVDNYLKGYKPIIANFIRKEENDGEVPLHQNWAFVDETKCASVSIWCPLVDSNADNGTLSVVPGTHKRYGKVRGPMIRSELEDIKVDIIANHMLPLETKAGEAVILDDSIVHYSAPNKTDGLRLAIQLILIPEEMESIHYHMDLSKDRNKVEVLKVDHEFYMNFNPWKKPSKSLKRINEFEYTPFSISYSEFKGQIHGKRFDNYNDKSGFVDKMKSAFFKS